jgi:monomeric isocitrate dehydrogenase
LKYFASVLKKYTAFIYRIRVDTRNGLGCICKIAGRPEQAAVEAANQARKRTSTCGVNSDKGITNLHVPSDVIVDASMPAMITSKNVE